MSVLDLTVTPYERMRESLSSAQECLSDGDRSRGQANWAGQKIAVACALQKAVAARTFVCRAILAAAGLADAEQAAAITQLTKLFGSIQREPVVLDFHWQPQDVVDFAHTQINAYTPIDESDAESKIAAAKQFVRASQRLLTEVLPRLVMRGFPGWSVLPPEDPAGGAYR